MAKRRTNKSKVQFEPGNWQVTITRDGDVHRCLVQLNGSPATGSPVTGTRDEAIEHAHYYLQGAEQDDKIVLEVLGNVVADLSVKGAREWLTIFFNSHRVQSTEGQRREALPSGEPS